MSAPTLTATEAPATDTSLALPVRPRVARFLVLAAVFLCAACGLVYELALVALGSYLVGDSVRQAAVVLSVMVFAMGVGSLAAKRLTRWPVASFAVIEGLLAVVGGLSVLVLYAAFSWLDLYQPALVVTAFLIGALIGAEIPLLMTMLQRIRRQDAGEAVADLFAADYVGALLGGLAFPFLLLPLLGQIKGALLVGALNAVAGIAVVLWLFRRTLARRAVVLLSVLLIGILSILGVAWLMSDRFEVSARQALFDAPVVHAEQTQYQDVVLTQSADLSGGNSDLRLFLNGDLQFSSVDEYRYHEALVHPAMTGPHERVLVLGGGDGLAMREVMKYPGVTRAVEVELDPAMVALARTHPELSELNAHAFDDPRVELVNQDAFRWLQENRERFDVIVVDMPDPDATATAKLYSVEFYALVSNALADGGRVVVQSGSPYFAREAFWCIDSSVRAAGFTTTPYQVDVPSFGNWGFVMASLDSTPRVEIDESTPTTRFLDAAVLATSTTFPKDRARLDLTPSTLVSPTIVEHERKGWKGY